MLDHSHRKHALLSASGAARWINCPPSARMEDSFKSESPSVFAEEGTLAHEFADLALRIQSYTGENGKGSQKQKWLDQVKAFKEDPLYATEMDEYVDVYTGYVLEQFSAARKATTDAVILIEEKTDFSYLVPEGFGTSDANIIADGVLEIVDLKYGKGIKVEAKENVQMRLYALGLLRKYAMVYDVVEVKMTIVQPRLYHIDSETLTAEELVSWSEDVVRLAAKKAYAGEGECNPGAWCRWCKAKPKCRALAKFNLKLASKDFAEPKELTDTELIEVYEQSGLLVDWANSVNKHLLSEALEGKVWEGYKLVEGRSVRKWADEEKALKALLAEDESLEVTNTKIKGIGAVEKLIGKVEFSKMGLTVRPQGKPTLVSESDKRPALGIEQAKKDFQ